MEKYRRLSIAAGQRLKEKEYWLEKLSGRWEKSIFPCDGGSASLGERRLNIHSSQISGELFERLLRISKQSPHTLHIILHTTLAILLNKYTGNDDVVVGTLIYRQENEADYINSVLAIRSRLGSHITFKELLSQVRQTIVEAIENRNYPIEILALDLNRPVLETGDFPLFDVAIILENIHDKKYFQDIHFNILFSFSMLPEKIEIEVKFNSSRYDNTMIQRILIHLIIIMHGVLFNVDTPISVISMLSEEEKHQLLVEFNNTDVEYPKEKTIQQLFREQVEKAPDIIALVGAEGGEEEKKRRREEEKNVGVDLRVCPNCLTYHELNKQSDYLAGLLSEKGVLPDTIVAIKVERSVEMIVGIMGILKSGGAYLPIDPDYPKDRIDYMLKDSNAKILINKSGIRNPEFESPLRGRSIDRYFDSALVLNFVHLDFDIVSNFEFHASDLIPSNLAYVIYTSGSTGRPKGVLIQHNAVVNRLNWMQQMYPLGINDIILQKTTYTFDVSVWELFWWSFYGARLCLLAPREEKDPAAIIKSIYINHISTIHFVPSMLNAFLAYLESSQESYRCVSLRQVFASGEALSAAHVEKFYRLLEVNRNCRARLINLYGPTEATVDVSYYNCFMGHHFDTITVPIGKPIHNARLYILDKHLHSLPVGIPGELFISGIGLARGYLNHPELTAERFISKTGNLFEKTFPDLPKLLINHHSPFTTHHSPLYQTGDLARWLPDGNIEFLGRIDYQVKIRGYRIELGEIENRLLKHEKIKEAVVLDKAYPDLDKYLVAYFVSENELSGSELREYLLNDLPEYMIPSYFMRIEGIPLTVNGKANRRALPESGFKTGDSYTAPRDEAERKLVVLWAEVLGRDALHASQLQLSIGINNNFFHLGGHSLKAIAMINKIHKTFGVSIELQDVFRHPTIAGIAQVIKNSHITEFMKIAKQPENEYYELSYAQKRLWYINKTEPANSFYNMSGKVTITEPCDLKLITGILEQLTTRHESLRTCFKEKDKAPIQVIEPKDSFKLSLEVIELRELPTPEREKVRAELYLKETMHIFDLEQPSLFRVKIINCAAGEYDLVFNMHHIISDGWSMEILKQEFQQLFEAYNKGIAPSLALLEPLDLQYKDYAAWQNRILADDTQMSKAQAFWREHLGGNLPIMNLPYDYSCIAGVHQKESAGYRLWIPGELTNCLRSTAIERNASLFMVLFAGFNLLLAKVTGQENIMVVIPAAARQHDVFKNIIGFFVNTLILCNRVAVNESFPGFFARLQDNTFNVLEYQSIPLELICGQLKIKYPEVPVFFNMINTGNTQQESLENLESYHLETVQDAKFDIVFYLVEYKNGIEVECHYYKNRFKPITIEKFMAQYKEILVNITSDPTRNLGEYFVSGKKRKFKRGNNLASE